MRDHRRSPRRPGNAYNANTYRNAVVRAVDKANADRAIRGLPSIPRWHPHQLRHAAATTLRREFGVEAARVVLGHASLAATEIYAEADLQKAREAMERIG